METLKRIRSILSKPRYLGIFLAVLLIGGFVVAITSDIIVVPSISKPSINPIAQPDRVGLMGVLVVLMATSWTTAIHNYEVGLATAKTTFLGTATTFFASACPICQPIWLVWLGLGSVTAFLAEFGTYIALLSIGLMTLSIYHSTKSVKGSKCEGCCKTCEGD